MNVHYALLAVPFLISMTVQTQENGWKEYVYSDDAFAITLPQDPHPHKSSQMANGRVYLVALSADSPFSLHTMPANDKCTDAVRSKKETYERTRTGSHGDGSGYKAISFQEVNGSGYNGVEFVQKLPTGRMDYERWICGAHRLYVFGSTWSSEQAEPKDLRRIVDSFRIVSPD